MAVAKSIKVKLGELTKPLRVLSVKKSTTLKMFLDKKNIALDSSVRVNGVTKRASYLLKADDIITIVSEVSGGRI